MPVIRAVALLLLAPACGLYRAVVGTARNVERTSQEAAKTAAEARKTAEATRGLVEQIAPYAGAAIVAALGGWKGRQVLRARRARRDLSR